MFRKTWFKVVAALIATPVLLTGVLFAHLYASQESLIFLGTPLPQDHEFVFDLPFEEVTIPVDGAAINALHFQQPDPRGLVFFLHGNGGNLDSWTSNVGYYQRVNYDLFIFDYRGYGKSTGVIESEQQLHDDVRAAWDSIVPQYRDKPIVIYGRSLGAALAARLANDVESELLVLVSPFTSLVEMARREYPYLPETLVRYPLRTDRIIADIQTPTIFVHGAEDKFIPIEHSLQLRAQATAQTKMLTINGAGHNDIHQFESYLAGLTAELPN